MIKANKTVVELKGKKTELLTEYSFLTKGMHEAFSEKDGEELAEYLIYQAMREGIEMDSNPKMRELDEEDDELMKKVDEIIDNLRKEPK